MTTTQRAFMTPLKLACTKTSTSANAQTIVSGMKMSRMKNQFQKSMCCSLGSAACAVSRGQ